MVALGAATLFAAEPFDVSLDYSQAGDLSPFYRARVRAATLRYIGDATEGSITVAHVYISHYAGRQGTLEIEEITGDSDATHFYLISRSSVGTRSILAEAHFRRDPFPPEPFTLRHLAP